MLKEKSSKHTLTKKNSMDTANKTNLCTFSEPPEKHDMWRKKRCLVQYYIIKDIVPATNHPQPPQSQMSIPHTI